MSICNPLGYDRRAPSTKRTYIILLGLEPLILLSFLRVLAAVSLATFGFPLLSSSLFLSIQKVDFRLLDRFFPAIPAPSPLLPFYY